MVNPTLTYDNEYNRRLRDIFYDYDDIQSSNNTPTMVVGGTRQMAYINTGNTPYDGREGTAPFSGSMYGGINIRNLTRPPITDMRYKGRDHIKPKMPSRAEIDALATGGFLRYMPKVMAYNAINNATGRHLPSLFGGKKLKKVGRAVSARHAIVSQVMNEYGLPLAQASKFVKDNGLY